MAALVEVAAGEVAGAHAGGGGKWPVGDHGSCRRSILDAVACRLGARPRSSNTCFTLLPYRLLLPGQQAPRIHRGTCLQATDGERGNSDGENDEDEAWQPNPVLRLGLGTLFRPTS